MSISKKEMIENLKELKSLFDAGVFTQEEYDAQKKEIIASASITEEKTQKEEPKEEKQPEEKEQPKVEIKPTGMGIVCSQCGSGSTTKIDEYTYVCNMCGTTIALPRPETKIVNMNSFVGGDDNIPVYQVVNRLNEDELVRKLIIYMAKHEKVSANLLGSMIIDRPSIELAYITYAEIPYEILMTYTCQIGTKYHYKDENGHTKEEISWEPFAGQASDSGISMLCTFGEETKTSFMAPFFFKESSLKFENFIENNKFPLKRRIDRSNLDDEKNYLISNLATKTECELPGDTHKDFKNTGMCKFGDIESYYYVPTYNVHAKSGKVDVYFRCAADPVQWPNYLIPSDQKFDEKVIGSMPDNNEAKSHIKIWYPKYNGFSLFALLLSYTVAIGSLVPMFVIGFYMLIPVAVGAVSVIVCSNVRKRMLNDVLNNLIMEFKNAKALACEKALRNNKVSAMDAKEKKEISAGSMRRKDTKVNSRTVLMAIFVILALVALIVFLIISIRNYQEMY